jgi:hypothetical protein
MSFFTSGSAASPANSAASMEMGAVTVATDRPSGSITADPRTSRPESPSWRVQARRKLTRYSSVWKPTSSAPSSPHRICSRQGSLA